MGTSESEISRAGRKPGNSQAGVDVIILRQNFFIRKNPVLKSIATNWMMLSHIIKNNLLCLKSIDYRC